MAVAVEGELVTGGRDLADDGWIADDLFTGEEEDRGQSSLFERREDRRCSLRVGTVVEREKNSVFACKPGRDAQGACCRR